MYSIRPSERPSRPARESGFTLIELMIAVAIVGILIGIALPNYRNYVIRGKLVGQTNALAGMRAQMEQFYLDNRTYLSNTSVTPNILSPCDDGSIARTYDNTFQLSCTQSTATSYTLRAAALDTALSAGAVYTVDQGGAMATTGFPTSWGAVPAAGAQCWLMRKAGGC
jgi:prepilin-type N-terminal cleavage/methylation domain-containing protein